MNTNSCNGQVQTGNLPPGLNNSRKLRSIKIETAQRVTADGEPWSPWYLNPTDVVIQISFPHEEIVRFIRTNHPHIILHEDLALNARRSSLQQVPVGIRQEMAQIVLPPMQPRVVYGNNSVVENMSNTVNQVNETRSVQPFGNGNNGFCSIPPPTSQQIRQSNEGATSRPGAPAINVVNYPHNVPVGISQDAAQTVPLMCRTDAASVPNAVHPMNEVAQGVQASIQVGSSNGNNDTQVPEPPKKTKAMRVPCCSY